jgi:hypothetical protein
VRIAAGLAALALLGACETTNSDDWSGSGGTPYRTAEKTCLTETQAISKEGNRREFFIGCMGALGWRPGPGASIDL